MVDRETVTDWDIHDHRNWVFSEVLRRQARRFANREWLRMIGGDTLSYARADAIANQVARLLQRLQVKQGDPVAVFVPNSLEYCYAWFGITRLGAVHVAVNTDYRGAFLQHVLNNSQAKLAFVQDDYLGRVHEIADKLPHLEHLVIVGDDSQAEGGGIPYPRTPLHRFEELSAEPVEVPTTYRDPACVMYTSGTTGPSKGVVMPQAHIFLFGLGTIENLRLTRDDVFYIVLPLFHANAMFMQLYATLIVGATAVLRNRFSATSWIKDIAEHRVTVTGSLGVVVAFALNQPSSDLDRQHRLRAIAVAPNPPELDPLLRRRFGVDDIVGLYGMTEVNIPLYTELGKPRPGSCGKVWDRYYELQIVDPETDLPVPAGTTGEIVVRPRLPFGFMTEYLRMPEKTVEAWRNFWFHTGDAATMDEEGYVYFVDRIKDCIRRRGENISSFELEQVLEEHPKVVEAAVVAVKAEFVGAEDEVKAVLVREGEVTVPALIEYCEAHLPKFAVPRYYEFVEDLPKTPTNKIKKHELREQGVNQHTVDRETLAHEKGRGGPG